MKYKASFYFEAENNYYVIVQIGEYLTSEEAYAISNERKAVLKYETNNLNYYNDGILVKSVLDKDITVTRAIYNSETFNHDYVEQNIKLSEFKNYDGLICNYYAVHNCIEMIDANGLVIDSNVLAHEHTSNK